MESVIPAKAGIQLFQAILDPGFRRGDDLETLTKSSVLILKYLCVLGVLCGDSLLLEPDVFRLETV
jgi:hypothetical protein